MTRATRVGVALAALLLVVLTASGAWSWWNYRPDHDQWIRTTHVVASVVLLVLAVALVVLAIVRRAGVGAVGVVASIGVLATTGGAYVTGRLLPWDQMALWAVIARPRWGVAATFDAQVKYVILRGREVSVSTYRGWAVAHLAFAVLVGLALVMVWLRARDREVSRRAPAPAPAPVPAEAGESGPAR